MKQLRCMVLVFALLPVVSTANDWKPLYDRVDPELQSALEKLTRSRPAWQRLVDRHRLAFCTVDMSTDPPRFARINGNYMMYAASLPKIAILLTAYAGFEDGTLEETEAVHEDLAAMIRVSSNAAATRLIDLVGMAKIRNTVQDPRFGFYDEKRGGGLWVGKRYASSGPRRGDPMHGISHGATATQVCRFYYLLASERVFNPHRSKQMLAELADPGLHHKFVAELDERAPDAKVYRKSGTWREWHSDSVLVHGTEWRNYILVGLVQSVDGEEILRSLLPAVEEILHPSRPTPSPCEASVMLLRVKVGEHFA